MEAQTETSQAQLPSQPQGPETPRLRPQSSTSVPSLRFPKPHGSRRLANWLANSDPGLLHQPANMLDAEDLGGSTFELVDAVDNESQDDRVTEYNSDLDVIRTTSEVHSLAESERSYDSDSDDEPGSRTHSLLFANQALQSPSLCQLAGLGADAQITPTAAAGRNHRARTEGDDRDLDTPSEDEDDDEDDDGEDSYDWDDDDGTDVAGKLAAFVSLIKSLSFNLPSQERIMQVVGHRHFTAIVVPLVMSLIATIFYGPAFTGISSSPAAWNAPQPMVTPLITAVATPSKTVPTTSTVVINHKISQAEPTASSLASAMSYVGLLSDKPSDVTEQDGKKNVFCTVEVFSKDEILIKLPSSSKTVWLAKGAIEIDVYRGEQPIKSKLSTSDEGILVGLRKQDAWGVLNVSVVTTRRPKINETFEVNFGRPLIEEALEASIRGFRNILSKLADPTAHLAEDTLAGWDRLRSSVADGISEASRAAQDVTTAEGWDRLRSSILDGISEAGRSAQDVTSRAVHGAMERVKSSQMGTFFKDTTNQLSRRLLSAENTRDQVGFTVTRASIGARITWLKMQGKAEEATAYERKAKIFLNAKHAELLQARREREISRPASTKKTDWSAWSRRKWCSGRSGPTTFPWASSQAKDGRKSWRKSFWSA